MSNRKKAFVSESTNPVIKWLEWKSKQKCFSYYDKEQGKNVDVKLPFKFLTIDIFHTIKGWHEKSNSGIYANEVRQIISDELDVKSYGDGDIAKGLYKDVKDTVNKVGGHYCKSIYVMLESGELCNIQLKGSAVQSWGDFTQKATRRLPDEWVEVVGAEDKKKGAVNYSVPTFEFKGSLTEDEGKLGDVAYDKLEAYKSPIAVIDEVEPEDVASDGLPF